MRILGATVLYFLIATPLAAQAPYLVRDINQTPDVHGSERVPRELTATPSALYFTGIDDANGREIRRLSASHELTLPLDLQPGSSSNAHPQLLTAAGDIVYFEFEEGIYRTDGTPGGVTLLRQFGPDFVQLVELTGVGTDVFFVESTNQDDTLWYSDGTPAGTIPLMVLGGFPGFESLTASNGRLFFVNQTAAAGSELWTSDGTVAGTDMVRDICPGSCPGPTLSRELVDAAGTLFFGANDNVNGTQLWKSDGTFLGTMMVANVLPHGQGIHRVTAFGNRVLFETASGDPELWRSDGTAAGTFLLRSGVTIGAIHDTGGLAFFDGDEPATGRELWKTDGTVAGTALVVDGCPGSCSFFPFEPVLGSAPGVLLFTRKDAELWRSDGTPGGTFQLRQFDTLPPSFTRFGGAAYFAANDGQGGRELWRSDGSVAGTQVVHEAVNVSSWQLALGRAGDRFFFLANRPDLGPEPWSTTGTEPSTTFVDLQPGPEGDNPVAREPLGDRLVLATVGQSRFRIWSSDGSPGGTSLLASDTLATQMGAANGLAFFNGASPPGNAEPWRTDGTPGGTFQLAELRPGVAGSEPSSFVGYRGRTFFTAQTTDRRVWQSDGTMAGTSVAIPRNCAPLIAIADTLYLRCSDAVTGFELWASDGTASGTYLVKDITPGTATSFFYEPVEMNGILYFVIVEPLGGGELWRSDGTEPGTYRVKDIVPGPEGSDPTLLTPLGGVLYFAAGTPATGQELWRSDGTDPGTVMVRDINPGSGKGVFDIEAAGGQIVLSAYTPAAGIEPWRSDGTGPGTVPLPEIAPGPSSSGPYDLHAAGGRVYFAADDGVAGFEPWAVVMPPGAVSVGDASVQEGDTGTRDVTFEVRLESQSPGVVQVAFTTIAGTAQAGVDFQPTSGVLTFAPGAVLATVDVPVVGDLADEADETFHLELSPVGNAVVSDPHGAAVVLDDDGPSVSITGATVPEGDAGSTSALFAVTLTTRDGGPTPNVKTVGFASAPVTATPGLDYVTTAGILTFAAGTPSGTVVTPQVTILGDTIDEADETFQVRLTPTSDVAVPQSPATGLIQDDDGVAALPPLELTHGARVRATLEPPPGRVTDRDWYVLRQEPNASYELLIDETSGDAVPIRVERIAADGSTVLQSAVATGTGASVSLRWQNVSSLTFMDQAVRVESLACGTTCGADDTYRVRLYETSLAAARFNNSGGQVTVVILQNTTDVAIGGRLFFWLSQGLNVVDMPFQLAARQVLVLNTSTVFPASSGTFTVTHDGGYGSLVGKAVALEPATGFSFDTPMTYRPR